MIEKYYDNYTHITLDFLFKLIYLNIFIITKNAI